MTKKGCVKVKSFFYIILSYISLAISIIAHVMVILFTPIAFFLGFVGAVLSGFIWKLSPKWSNERKLAQISMFLSVAAVLFSIIIVLLLFPVTMEADYVKNHLIP